MTMSKTVRLLAVALTLTLMCSAVAASSSCHVGGVYLSEASAALFSTGGQNGKSYSINPCAETNPLNCGGEGWPGPVMVEVEDTSPGYSICVFAGTNLSPWKLVKDTLSGEYVARKTFTSEWGNGARQLMTVSIGCFGSSSSGLQCVNASSATPNATGCHVASTSTPAGQGYDIRLSTSVMCTAKPQPKMIHVKRYSGKGYCQGTPVSTEQRAEGACVPGLDLKTSTQWICGQNPGNNTLWPMSVVTYSNSSSCEGQPTVFNQFVGCDLPEGSATGSVLVECPH